MVNLSTKEPIYHHMRPNNQIKMSETPILKLENLRIKLTLCSSVDAINKSKNDWANKNTDERI